MARCFRMNLHFKNIAAAVILLATLFFILSLYKYFTSSELQNFIPKPTHVMHHFQQEPKLLDMNKYEHVTGDSTYIINLLQKDDNKEQRELTNETTLVTMYFNIGAFSKGVEGNDYTPDLYYRWMLTFNHIQNPVLAFFDKQEDLNYFANLRRRLDYSLTKTVLLDRTKMWAFSLENKIDKIFSKPHYAKHYPNTIRADYSCAMHAKYEIMQAATTVNYFNTTYIAWLDIGLFRELAYPPVPDIHIGLPINFNDSSIAYSEVYRRDPKVKPLSIISANLVWVCGCFFIGTQEKMNIWSKEYMKGTEALIDNFDLMSTDQQVIYIIFNLSHPKTSIQLYRRTPEYNMYNEWFYLAYICKEVIQG